MSKSVAVRGLVYQYLTTECPVAARRMRSAVDDAAAAPLSEAALEAELQAAAARKAHFGADATLQSVMGVNQAGQKRPRSASSTPAMKPTAPAMLRKAAVSSSDSDSDVPAPKAAPKAAPKPATKKVVSSSDSDSDAAPVVKKVATPKAAPKPVKKVVSSSDSDSDVAPVVKKVATPKAAPKLVKKVASSSDSDSDVPAPKAATKPVAKPVAKKVVSSSDSDSDAAPVVKKVATPKAAPKPVKKAASSSDSDSDVPVVTPKAAPKVVTKKPIDSDSDDEAPTKVAAPTAEAEPEQPYVRIPKVPNERFCRVDVANVKFANESLRDNRPMGIEASFRQNQLMMAVKGKDFAKHKQKNKGKLYAAGVDLSIRSFKFASDSE